ncbi:MAG: hypothetical protein ACKOX6_11320 [Bdellovibrio sp.]
MTRSIFSETELQLLELLGSRRMTILDLTAEHYKNRRPPLNPNNVVSSAIVRINKKCEYYNEDWFINGEGLGRGGRTVWKEKRKKESNNKKKVSKKNSRKE